MNLSTRSLVLVTVCSLWSACGEEASSTSAKPQATAAKAARMEAKPTPAQTSLTGSAPAVPATILDQPKEPKLAPTAQPLALEKPDEPKPEPAIDFDRPLDAGEVEVDRFVLSHGVENREPVDPSDVFTTDTKKIFAFVQLANGKAPYAFRVHWEKVDEAPSPYGVKLTVPTAERYRTWSWTAIKREPGRYKAVLRTLAGDEIMSREFTIEPGEDCVAH